MYEILMMFWTNDHIIEWMIWSFKKIVDEAIEGWNGDLSLNKTKSLKSRERGKLKLKRWMMIKVDWWLKLFDD